MTKPSGRRWGRQIWALDDMKALKTGKKIWGTCSFHEYTSRCCNHPEAVEEIEQKYPDASQMLDEQDE